MLRKIARALLLRFYGLDYFGYGASYGVEIVAVERSYANPSGTHRVDGELISQALDLFAGETRVREHAALTCNKAEVAASA